MRALIFLPQTIDGAARRFLKDDISTRLSYAEKLRHGPIKPVDAEAEHGVADWQDVVKVLQLYPSVYNCVVMGVNGSAASQPGGDIKHHIGAIATVTGGMPVIAYVDQMRPDTACHLLKAGIVHMVDRAHDASTLACFVGHAVAAHAAPSQVVRLGPLAIDLAAGTSTFNGELVQFSSKENELLTHLARCKGRPVSVEKILDYLYDGIDVPEPKIINVFICKLRKKLNALEPRLGDILRTEWGNGYRLVDYVGKAPDAMPASWAAAVGESTHDTRRVSAHVPPIKSVGLNNAAAEITAVKTPYDLSGQLTRFATYALPALPAGQYERSTPIYQPDL